ncbi:MAG TPA: efflux RND transporter permease subunit [Nannocystaceae bacterium]|nr:efflux RND transporter permease subunit [Nannocystaceae bacterium]
MEDGARKTFARGAIAWMAQNPVAANLLMLMLIVGGVLMGGRVRQEVFPETELDMISISVPYPGASPDEVETGIILAIEEAVRGVDGVKRVTSVASEGNGRVNVELTIDVDPTKALSDVKSTVDRITSLPRDAERPTVSLLTNRSEVISIVLYGEQRPAILRELAERARDQILTDPGITQVDLAGAPPKEIAIEVPQAQLRTYGLTLEQIAQKVASTALQLPGGSVKTPGGEVLIRTDERRSDALEFAAVPVVTSPNGTELTVGDIGTVEETFAETDESATFEGEPAVMVRVYRTGDQTPVDISEKAKVQIEKIRRWLPPGVKIAIWRDMSEIYRQRIDLLLRNAYSGLVLVLISLGLFLEIRLAFWVTMGIPISFLGALLLMPGFDVSVNMISLFAFIVTLGMVVDDAIVIGENIYERRQRGESFLDAAIAGAKEVATPVVFSIATTCVAFAPLFFVPGFSGKLFRVIPLIVITVLLISLLESIFVLPAHLGHLRDIKEKGLYAAIHRRQQWFSRGLENFVERRFGPVLNRVLDFRYAAFALGLALLILTFGLVGGGRIGFRFMPNIDGDVITASVELPFGTSVERTEAVQRRILDAARQTLTEFGGDRIKRGLYAQIGGKMASSGPRPTSSGLTGGHMATVQVYLVSPDDRDFDSAAFTDAWRAKVGTLVEAKSLTFSANMGPSAGAPVDVELSHADTAVLDRAAADVVAALTAIAGVTDVQNGVDTGKPQLNLTLTPEAVSLGLTVNDIARQVRGSFFGAEALRQQEGRNEVKVIARLPEEERRSEYNIEELLVRTPQGGEIPLREAAELQRGRSWPLIERADGRRIIHVTADVREGSAITPGAVLEKLTKEILVDLPDRYPGLQWGMGGANREQQDSLGSLATGGKLALIAIYILLAIPFRSYVQPVIVMMAIPFGIVGAIGGHVLLGYDLSMISMMGIVALSGVVVNDSLVLIDAANTFRAAGDSSRQAIFNAGKRRFRPILLTSITTFFGLMPMILETSVQARFLIPMAISLGFGVMFATFITLLIIPALYLILEDVRENPRVALALALALVLLVMLVRLARALAAAAPV